MVLAIDADAATVEALYQQLRIEETESILPGANLSFRSACSGGMLSRPSMSRTKDQSPKGPRKHGTPSSTTGLQPILPLVVDVADPTPNRGWRGWERKALTERGKPDLILCLALLHHLVLGRSI